MIEQDLKDYIKQQFKGMPQFAEASGIKYQTLMAIFDRGLTNANIVNIFKLCRTLNISADGLAQGRIVPLAERSFEDISSAVNAFNARLDSVAIDGKQISEQERETLLTAIETAVAIIRKRR